MGTNNKSNKKKSKRRDLMSLFKKLVESGSDQDPTRQYAHISEIEHSKSSGIIATHPAG